MFFKFCCEPKTYLKIKVYNIFKSEAKELGIAQDWALPGMCKAQSSVKKTEEMSVFPNA